MKYLQDIQVLILSSHLETQQNRTDRDQKSSENWNHKIVKKKKIIYIISLILL